MDLWKRTTIFIFLRESGLLCNIIFWDDVRAKLGFPQGGSAESEYRASSAQKSIKNMPLKQFDLAKALVYTSV